MFGSCLSSLALLVGRQSLTREVAITIIAAVLTRVSRKIRDRRLPIAVMDSKTATKATSIAVAIARLVTTIRLAASPVIARAALASMRFAPPPLATMVCTTAMKWPLIALGPVKRAAAPVKAAPVQTTAKVAFASKTAALLRSAMTACKTETKWRLIAVGLV
jgi:hypothetical protein